MSDTPHADKFRAVLEKVGGWDNLIETLAAIEGRLAAARMMLNDTSCELQHNQYADDNEWSRDLENKIDAWLVETKKPGDKV